jgi:hypothetical protein
MNIRMTTWKQRRVWELDNDYLSLTMMVGGGHFCRLNLRTHPDANLYWEPHWRSLEPWQYRAADAPDYGNDRLLACIAGHNPCLGAFGPPSPEEQRQGLSTHYEAPVARWTLLARRRGVHSLMLRVQALLPAYAMRLVRTVTTQRGSPVVRVVERLTNLARRDVPFTMCQHVTVGAPLLEKGVTLFDMPATRGHTMPTAFSNVQRLRQDAAFTWPKGPGVNGPVDLRMIGRQQRRSSDFSTQLMHPQCEQAWFAAGNPRLGLLLAYVWRRADYPWVGNWEENYGRRQAPWHGKELTRGMEFSNTPFPLGLRHAVDLGTFHGERTYRWLPARASMTFVYYIIAQTLPAGYTGVSDIHVAGGRARITYR